MIIAFTGHRPDELGGYDETNPIAIKVKERIRQRLTELKPEMVISGMALGVDMWAAEIAIELGIPVHAAVPFKGQESIWPTESQKRFNQILSKCAKVTVVSDGTYAAWKMLKRNAFMVNKCDLLLAVWNGKEKGGTYQCTEYAKSVGKSIEFLFDPKELNA